MSQTLAKALNRNAPQITEDERVAGEKSLQHIEQNIDRTLFKYDDEESLERLSAMEVTTTASYIWPIEAVRQMRKNIAAGIVPSGVPVQDNSPSQGQLGSSSSESDLQQQLAESEKQRQLLQGVLNRVLTAAKQRVDVNNEQSIAEVVNAVAVQRANSEVHAGVTVVDDHSDCAPKTEYDKLQRGLEGHGQGKCVPQTEYDKLAADLKDMMPKEFVRKQLRDLQIFEEDQAGVFRKRKVDLLPFEKVHNTAYANLEAAAADQSQQQSSQQGQSAQGRARRVRNA